MISLNDLQIHRGGEVVLLLLLLLFVFMMMIFVVQGVQKGWLESGEMMMRRVVRIVGSGEGGNWG
jgi:hypothetical protein